MSRKIKKQIAWDAVAAQVRKLHGIAAAFTTDGGDLDGSSTRTEKPLEAREAWWAVVAKIESQDEDFQKDPWVSTTAADAGYNVACMSSLLREKDEALRSLDAAIQKGFKNLALLEKDLDFNWLRNEPVFKKLVDDLRVGLGPLTIEKVIRGEIKRGMLTSDGIDPSIDAKVRSCVVHHHEWIRSPELKGVACLMLASFGGVGVALVHDVIGKALFPSSKLDGTKFEIIET